MITILIIVVVYLGSIFKSLIQIIALRSYQVQYDLNKSVYLSTTN